MALFKILRGPSSELINLPITDGFCYFTPDTGLFHIDYDGQRVPLNAKDAETLMGASLKHTLSENEEDLRIEIPSSYLLNQIISNFTDSINSKQDKVNGEEGQIVGFGQNGQLVAIDAAASSEGLIDQNSGSLIKLWYGTVEEYEAIEAKDENTIYILSNEVSGPTMASDIEYYNGLTGMAATNVQAAIDELFAAEEKAEDALSLVIEMGFVDPVASNQGSVYTDNSGKLYSL